MSTELETMISDFTEGQARFNARLEARMTEDMAKVAELTESLRRRDAEIATLSERLARAERLTDGRGPDGYPYCGCCACGSLTTEDPKRASKSGEEAFCCAPCRHDSRMWLWPPTV